MWTVFASAFFLQFLLGVTVASALLRTGKLHIPVPFMMISGPVDREEGFFMLALFSVSVLMAVSPFASRRVSRLPSFSASKAEHNKEERQGKGRRSKDRRPLSF